MIEFSDQIRARAIIEEADKISDHATLERLAAHINDLLRQSRRRLAMATKSELRPGDRVRIGGSISPKYLVGCEGTVAHGVAARPHDVSVKVDDAAKARRFRRQTVGIPANCLEKI